MIAAEASTSPSSRDREARAGIQIAGLHGISRPLDYEDHVEPMVADMAALLATAALVRKVDGRVEQFQEKCVTDFRPELGKQRAPKTE